MPHTPLNSSASSFFSSNLRNLRINAFLLLVLTMIVCADVHAIQPSTWTHTAEADFEPGETHDTVVTNLGDVKLAQHTAALVESIKEGSIVYDLASTADGALYMAVGPEAKLLCRRGDAVEQVLELKKEQIFCLDLLPDGKLLVGISGAKSRLAVLEGKELKDVATLDKVRYIWDMVVDGRTIYLATGTEGKLLRVILDAEGGPKVDELLDAAQTNLLCLVRDKKGRLFAGSDTDGLVYRVSIGDDGKPNAFVVYDAQEPEIGALMVMENGTIYAGTADAEQARPGRLEEAVKEQKGRPEGGTTPVPGPAKPDADPPKEPPKVEPAPEPVTPQGEKGMNGAAPAKTGDAAEPPGVAAAPATPAAPAAPEPTAEQRDQLRETIRQRLLSARESGRLQVSPANRRRTPAPTPAARTTTPRPGAAQPKRGNAIYRITEDGFVSEVFRESVMILRMLDHQGRLIVASGNEGQIFSVDVDKDETTMLVKLKPSQIPAMLVGPEGHILLGTANPASLLRLDPGYAAEGDYTSSVQDASQISQWGNLSVTAEIPDGASLIVETRSGNVADPEKAAWSAWVETGNFAYDAAVRALSPRFASIKSAPARFFQYRLKLKGTSTSTPIVDRVEVSYVVPNLKPQIKSIKAAYPDNAAARRPATPGSTASNTTEPPPPPTKMNLEWEAEDPNKDELTYKLEYQIGGADVWLPIDKDLTQNRYEWETRVMPDGRYRIRVTASDSKANPAEMAQTATRTSDPVLIDNSPPGMQIGKPEVVDGASMKLVVSVADTLSSIREVVYTIDGQEPWKLVLPADLIYDSTNETVTIIIAGLSSGQHVVTIRATDSRDNASYQALMLNVTTAKGRQE